jgi:IclR family transcriptional regulator, pca regulon regulatory protein
MDMSISVPARRTKKENPRRPDEFVQSFARGLAVIKALGAAARPVTLSEVAEDAKLSRAAARRILLTLVHLGYVSQDGRQFHLLPRVLELGYAYLSAMGAPELAQPIMNQLAASAGESCSLSVLDDDEIVYIARVPTRKIMAISLGVGTRLPACFTSMGRVLLGAVSAERLKALLADRTLPARTPKTITDPVKLARRIGADAERGFAVVDEELEIGLCSIAVPVVDTAGRVVAALNIGASRSAYTPADLEQRFLPLLRQTSALLTPAIGTRLTPVA